MLVTLPLDAAMAFAEIKFVEMEAAVKKFVEIVFVEMDPAIKTWVERLMVDIEKLVKVLILPDRLLNWKLPTLLAVIVPLDMKFVDTESALKV